MTEWRDLDELGYSNYQVSNTGFVKNKSTGRILKGIANKYGYLHVDLCNESGKKYHLMHRLVAQMFIPNPDNKPCVDHIDHDKLNNCASNLRWCTTQENNHNQSKRCSNTSGFKGVTWNRHKRKWRARIGIGGRDKYLGLFDTAEEAARAYNKAASELHGAFACINDLIEPVVGRVEKIKVEITLRKPPISCA